MPNLQDIPATLESAVSTDDVLLGHEQTLGKTRLFTIGTLINVFKTGFALGTAAFKNTGTGANDVATGNHTHAANTITGLGTVATTNSYDDLSNKPTLGDAASKNTGTTSGTVAAGNHTHTSNDITDFIQAARTALEYATGAPVATLSALRAIGSANRQDKQVRLSESNNFLYRFDAEGTGTDDDEGIIKPTDIASGSPGRWFKIGGGGSGDTATFNGQSPSYYLNRTNHSGTQPATTITGLATSATTGSYNDLVDKPTLGTSASKNIGTTADTVASGDDSRFTNSRTPTAHKSSHAVGGSDVLTPSDIGAATATALTTEISDRATADSGLNTRLTTAENNIISNSIAPLKSKSTTVTGNIILLEADIRPDMTFTGNRTVADVVTFPLLSYPYIVLVTNETTGTGTFSIKQSGGNSSTIAKGETVRFRVSS